VDAVLRLKGNPSLEMIHVIKKPGGTLRESFLDEGFILDKKIGVGQPKRVENAKILVRAPHASLSHNERSVARLLVARTAKAPQHTLQLGLRWMKRTAHGSFTPQSRSLFSQRLKELERLTYRVGK